MLQRAHRKALHDTAEILDIVQLLAQQILVLLLIVRINVSFVSKAWISTVILCLHLQSGIIIECFSSPIPQQLSIGIAGIPLVSSRFFVFFQFWVIHFFLF